MTSQVEPPNPNDLSYYAPPRLRERAKSISLSQEARSGLQDVRSEPASSSFSHPPSPDIQFKKPLYLRGPLAPEIIDEPDGLVPELRRGALFGVVGRFAAIAAVLTVVALLFGLLLHTMGTDALIVSAGLSLAALGALALLRAQPVSARA